MKAVVYDAPRNYAVEEIPVPEAGPGEVRIKVVQLHHPSVHKVVIVP